MSQVYVTISQSMIRMPEQVLVNQVLAYLTLKKHYVWRQNTGAMTTKEGRFIKFGHKGISDVLGVARDGKMIAIECKIKPNKPTQFQVDFLDEIKRRGGYAVLAYELEDVQKVL